MSFNYNRLWKILIDKGMNKTQLRESIGIGTATLAKLSANETVSLDVIGKLCQFLDCQPGDIMEYVPNEATENNVQPEQAAQTITEEPETMKSDTELFMESVRALRTEEADDDDDDSDSVWDSQSAPLDDDEKLPF